MSDALRLAQVRPAGVPLLRASPPPDPRPQPRSRHARILRYACALHARELGLGEDYREREWARLDPRDQAIILRWLALVEGRRS